MAVAATGTKIGILGRQCSCFCPVHRIGIRVLCRDGTAALTLADKRTLEGCQSAVGSRQRAEQGKAFAPQMDTHGQFGLELARELLQVGKLLLGRHVAGGVGHGKCRGAAVLVLELVVKARGRKDRGADRYWPCKRER